MEILQWFKNEGDAIEEFEALCEVQSDKATVTITSPFSGIITKRHYDTGDIAKTGLALIDVRTEDVEEEGEAEEAAPREEREEEERSAAPAANSSSSTSSSSRSSGGGKALASPAVRRLAAQKGLDLTRIPATGRDGRVLKGDVLAFTEGSDAAKPVASSSSSSSTSSSSPSPSTSSSPTPASSMRPPAVPRPAPGKTERETLKGIRKAMVKSMTPAAEVPWFGYSDDVEMDGLMSTRALLRPRLEADGVRLTYMPFMLKALATALQQYPILNTTLEGEELVWHGDVNLGVAMDTPKGLVVPNIKQCSHLSLPEIAAELQRLQGLAASGQLGPADLSGGTFTLSNIGNVGGTILSPVPMPGETAIGAVGRTRPTPRVDAQGQIVVRHVMNVSWRADHRVVDGATLARFSESWRSMVEQPVSMLEWLR